MVQSSWIPGQCWRHNTSCTKNCQRYLSQSSFLFLLSHVYKRSRLKLLKYQGFYSRTVAVHTTFWLILDFTCVFTFYYEKQRLESLNKLAHMYLPQILLLHRNFARIQDFHFECISSWVDLLICQNFKRYVILTKNQFLTRAKTLKDNNEIE